MNLGKPIYCPVCASQIGDCDHNRMDMIIHILQAFDEIKLQHFSDHLNEQKA